MIALALLLAAAPANASVLSVEGLPGQAGFTVEGLKALGEESVEWEVHGQKRTCAGTPLDKVLAKAGFSAGPMGKDVGKKEKRSGWKLAVVASASDGFQAVFSAAELFPEMGPTRAVVCWTIDGKPQEPLRLVVPTDREPSR